MMYYNPNKKQHSKAKVLIKLLFIVVLMYFMFNFGKSVNQGNLDHCNYQRQDIENKIKNLENKQIILQKDKEKILIAKNLQQEKYQKLVSSEEVYKLFKDVNKKLESGVDLPRVERAISELRADRGCSLPKNKRFIVKTPLYKGEISNTNVSVDNVFDITAEGYSFINENKKPESWFDIEKPVSINFTSKNGVQVIKEVLPLQKSMILDDREYFFTITEALSKGFVNISTHSCSYP